jgi:hypothetical protein
MSSSFTSTSSYTFADIEKVVCNFRTDLLMMADSSKAMSQDEARKYANDVECLAKNGYLKSVDVTLLDVLGTELRAVRYDVDTQSGGMTGSRPGGVRWPQTQFGSIRVVVWYTSDYDDVAKEKLREKLEISWGPTSVDTSHSSLKSGAGREYASNGFSMQRKDFTQ